MRTLAPPSAACARPARIFSCNLRFFSAVQPDRACLVLSEAIGLASSGRAGARVSFAIASCHHWISPPPAGFRPLGLLLLLQQELMHDPADRRRAARITSA